jgi:fluoride exporter
VTPVLFAVAAGTGALVRWRVGLTLPLPFGTLVVNIVGAFALGLVDHWSGPELTVVGVAGMGALTTFSTLSDDVVGLAVRRPIFATTYLVVTITGGLGAAALGIAIGG